MKLILCSLKKTYNLYGPLVKFLEGINHEEGYLRYVKLKITSVRTKNWNMNIYIFIE